jgi:hypothetical protein
MMGSMFQPAMHHSATASPIEITLPQSDAGLPALGTQISRSENFYAGGKKAFVFCE